MGKLFSYLPFDPIAYRFHLFSAVCAAVAAAFTTATAQGFLTQSPHKQHLVLATIPAFIFAFSPLVWNQAIVAEVYTLNLAVVAIFLWALLGKRPYTICGFFFGLSLTTHLTSLFLLPLALFYIPPHKIWQFIVAAFVGLSPFLLLPFLARQGSPVLWGDPTTAAGWWWLVSAKIYHPNQFNMPINRIWQKIVSWIPILALQLGFFGWPLLFYSEKRVRKSNKTSQFPSKTWWLLVGTAVLYISYAFFYDTQDSIILTLPAMLIFSLCLMPALEMPALEMPARERATHWGFLLLGITLLLQLSSYNSADIHNVRLQTEQILDLSPPNAILITAGDSDIFSLWYFHHVEKQRPDIILVDDNLFAFDWYRANLKQLYPNLRALEEDNLPLFQKENEARRPICDVSLQPKNGAFQNIKCSQDGS